MLLSQTLQRFDSTNLRLRVISAAIMAPIALLAVYLGGIVYGAVITGALTIGLYEWLRLIAPEAKTQTVSIACALLVALMAAGFLFPPVWSAIFGFVFTVGLYLISSMRDKDPNAKWIAFGIPYMGCAGLSLMALRFMPEYGGAFIFYLLAVVWITDIGAYLFGCAIRGPKLAPSISPKKTWAGFFGGLIMATIIGYAVAALFGARHPSTAILLSPVLSGVSQAGDLFESYFKRRSGVKESGDLIPGHGGVLDRIDGLVFAGIFAFLFQMTLGVSLHWW